MIQVCFIGVGSIAKRHIRNLVFLFKQTKQEFQIDCIRRNKMVNLPLDLKGIISNVYNYEDILDDVYDIMFITNPTSEHYRTLKKYKNKARHFFIEKPIFDNEFYDTHEFEGLDIYVACPLRYHSVIDYLKRNITGWRVIGVRCICSSYLPEWRPGEDYRKNYSAIKKLGGGVATDLIHEWDYLQYIFGRPTMVKCITGTKSDLEITSEDIAIYIAEYEKMTLELHLDYYGRVSRREIEIFTDEDTIKADLLESSIHFFKAGQVIDFSQKRDDYQIKELGYALDIFSGKERNINNLVSALETLKLVKGDL